MKYALLFKFLVMSSGAIYLLVRNTYLIIIKLLYYFFRESMEKFMLKKPLSSEYKETLIREFVYYQQLSAVEKDLFERRVQKFIDIKEFIPREMKVVTAEMKTLIAAAANQVAFGLPGVYLRHFSRILVYPDDYYSAIRRQYHRGEVNPSRGIIVLSWRHFTEGYLNPEEGRNLALHEMAHALKIEDVIKNHEFNFLNEKLLHQWKKLAYKEMECILSGEKTFFRAYAAENHHEFFAVAMENFFERPQAFHTHNPELYKTLTKLLNQDPLVRLEKHKNATSDSKAALGM